ncbi:hypothetical protein [Streptomyces sp. NBC_01320]|nr:hypothetical protein OG395_08265 [Streptomyces sp. NBC_01320]
MDGLGFLVLKAVFGPEVGTEAEGLEQFDDDAAVALHDALGYARRAR